MANPQFQSEEEEIEYFSTELKRIIEKFRSKITDHVLYLKSHMQS